MLNMCFSVIRVSSFKIFVYICILLLIGLFSWEFLDLYLYWIVTLGCAVCKSIFPLFWLPLCLNDSILWCAGPHSHEVPIIVMTCVNGVLFRKLPPVPLSSRLFFTFSLRLSISGCVLRSLIYVVTMDPIRILLQTAIQFDQRYPIFSSVYFCLLRKI